MSVTGAVHTLLRGLGLDVRRYRDPLRFLQNYGIKTVLDIGANSGQFAGEIRRTLPDATIHSFEPLPGPHDALLRRMAGDAAFFAYEMALGESAKYTTILENEFTPSTSLLSLCQRHKAAFAFARRTSPRRIRMTTLDEWAANRQLVKPLMVKVDVQGYEDRVLAGAARTLPLASVVMIEVSFHTLYAGQLLFEDIHDILRRMDFHCGGMLDSVAEKSSGVILQADAVFIHQSADAEGTLSLHDSLAV